jgi:phosphosulfolactate phosphohydrolase-like enzyme
VPADHKIQTSNPGFDLSNSPAEFIDKYLKGQHLIQKTTSGKQGVVRRTAKRIKI